VSPIADDLVRASAFDAPAAKRLARSAGGWDERRLAAG